MDTFSAAVTDEPEQDEHNLDGWFGDSADTAALMAALSRCNVDDDDQQVGGCLSRF